MSERGPAEYSRSWRELYRTGVAALEDGSPDVAVVIFNQILKREPGFVACRQALRQAQLKASLGRRSSLRDVAYRVASGPLLAKGEISKRRHPLEAIRAAEIVLNREPRSAHAHRLLAEAALAAGMPRTAQLSVEILARLSPQSREAAHRLRLAVALQDRN